MRQRNMWICETGRERPADPVQPEITVDTDESAEAVPDAIEPLVVVESVPEVLGDCHENVH